MKKLLFVITGLSVTLYAFAQSYAIDSMKRILHGTSFIDSNKVKLCLQLSAEWLKINSDSALAYANKSYDMATATNFHEGLADARLMQAEIYKMTGRYDKAYEFYLEAMHKYNMVNDNEGVGQVYIYMGNMFDKQDNYLKALLYFQQALNTYTKTNQCSGIARTYIAIARVHSKVNESEKAIANFLKAVEHAKLSYDRNLAIDAHIGLCKEYGIVGSYDKALQSAIRAKNLALITGMLPPLAEANYNIGKAYSDLGIYDSAHQAFKVALIYFNQLKNKEKVAKTYDGIGELYYLENDYGNAIQSIKISNQYALEMGDKSLLQVNYAALIAIARAQGDYKAATDYFDEILALRDTIYSTEKNVSIAKVRSGFELEKKQATIAELQRDNLDKTHQRNLFIIGFIVVGFLTIGLVFSSLQIKKKSGILEKQKKELEELNTVKDKFFSIIGHDLRTPMANILSLLHILNDDNFMTEKEKKELFEKLTISTTSALETMDNLLAWGMNQIKQTEMETREIDVQEIAERICRFLQPSAEQKSIRLINNLREPVIIMADKNQVEFVIRNLMSNALKFSHKNGIVEVWASNGKGANNIHIRDNGTGMSPELRHKLFDEKKNNSTKGTAGETGSGLGLLLSKQFITKNNGSLSVESEQGKGSTFTVSLPQATF